MSMHFSDEKQKQTVNLCLTVALFLAFLWPDFAGLANRDHMTVSSLPNICYEGSNKPVNKAFEA